MAQIDNLLKQLVAVKASDLHLCCGVPPLMRMYGKMKIIPDQPIHTHQTLEALLQEIMPPRNYQEFSENGDTDFGYEIVGVARFRVNIFMDRNGIAAVFRVIPDKIMTVEDLKLPEAIVNLCHLSKGLVLVTGPTGSGKSTTLAALIDYVNRIRDDHIITIEDPIEFVYKNQRCLVNQREVQVHTRSFKSALRAALREDPDVILVGELRDLETTEMAIETAETGHLVFGTLHTNTAASTVDRLIDQFPTNQQAQIRMMLSASLKAVISQVLLPRQDGSGMVAAMEILIVNQAISANIREGKTYQIDMVIGTSKRIGMKSLNESLTELVLQKTISVEDAYIASVDKDTFARELERLAIRFNPAQLNTPKITRGGDATLGRLESANRPSEQSSASRASALPGMALKLPGSSKSLFTAPSTPIKPSNMPITPISPSNPKPPTTNPPNQPE